MLNSSANPAASVFHVRALAADLRDACSPPASRSRSALPLALLSSIFIVELAPAALRRVTIPVIRLLASVPSVIYGLIGVLVLVPFVGNHLITTSEKTSVAEHRRADRARVWLVTVVILTVMITPIMVALICEALGAVPRHWREGAVALGLNPLRATLAVTRARDPPGDRGGRRARDRTGYRRGDHDLRWSRAGALRAQPRRMGR